MRSGEEVKEAAGHPSAFAAQRHNKYFVTGTWGDFAVSYYEGEELMDIADGFLLEDTAAARAEELNEALHQKQLNKLFGTEPLRDRVIELEALALNLVRHITNNGLLEQNPFARDRNTEMVGQAMNILDKGSR